MNMDSQTLVLMILLPILPLALGVGGFLLARRFSKAEYRRTQVAIASEEAKDLYRRLCRAVRQASESDPDEAQEGIDFLVDAEPMVDLLPEPLRQPFYAWVDAAADALIGPSPGGGPPGGAVSPPNTVERERECRGAARDAIARYEIKGA